MRTRTVTLLSLTIIALLMVGSFAFIRPGASETLIAEQVKIRPMPFDLANGDDVVVELKLNIDDTPVVDQIDPSTVLLEGALMPIDTWLGKGVAVQTTFYAKFDGNAVTWMLWGIISHMDITSPHPRAPVKIPLTITGELNDGTPWEGVGEIKVLIPNPGPPPPPPP